MSDVRRMGWGRGGILEPPVLWTVSTIPRILLRIRRLSRWTYGPTVTWGNDCQSRYPINHNCTTQTFQFKGGDTGDQESMGMGTIVRSKKISVRNSWWVREPNSFPIWFLQSPVLKTLWYANVGLRKLNEWFHIWTKIETVGLEFCQDRLI